jgi:D-alanyl-D-alanine-carboxypeptidase/D-alanyl-D-alanine-endopeptidase
MMIPGWYKELASNTLDTVAHMLLKQNKVNEAIRIFRENAESYPDDSNVYDSLAEAYSVQGDRVNAIKYYKKSLEMDPNNAIAMEILRHLE